MSVDLNSINYNSAVNSPINFPVFVNSSMLWEIFLDDIKFEIHSYFFPKLTDESWI